MPSGPLKAIPSDNSASSWFPHPRGKALVPSGSQRLPEVPDPSEHGMVVRRALRDRLHHVPVLDHLAVLQAEEVSHGGSPIVGRGLEQAVGHYHVALSDGALDLEAHLGELLGETLNETDERLEAVGCLGGCAGYSEARRTSVPPRRASSR